MDIFNRFYQNKNNSILYSKTPAKNSPRREPIPCICGLGVRFRCERFKRTFKPQRLKSQICFILVCIPSSRQLKKYKIFVLPGRISGNIFMPPIVAFHEIPLVLRLQVLSVAGRLYSNLYIL